MSIDINQFIFRARDLTAPLGKIVTIMGDAGVGKTTIANACFPAPVFIPIEPGLFSVPDAVAIQRPNNTGELMAFLAGIKSAAEAGNFGYKSVILDSVSELETMAVQETCVRHGVTTLADIKGFGAGYSDVAAVHRAVREACDELVKLGLNVVFIAHAVSKTEEFPDNPPYSRWVLQVGKGGSSQYLSQVDACIHVKNAVNLTEVMANGAKTKIAKTIKNQRILDMVPKPSSVSKNRFAVSDEIYFHWSPDGSEFSNPLAPIFGFDG